MNTEDKNDVHYARELDLFQAVMRKHTTEEPNWDSDGMKLAWVAWQERASVPETWWRSKISLAIRFVSMEGQLRGAILALRRIAQSVDIAPGNTPDVKALPRHYAVLTLKHLLGPTHPFVDNDLAKQPEPSTEEIVTLFESVISEDPEAFTRAHEVVYQITKSELITFADRLLKPEKVHEEM